MKNRTAANPSASSVNDPRSADTDRTMRMTRHRKHSNFVISSKTTTAIPAPSPLLRDLVIQSALDGHVRSIEFVHRFADGRRPTDAGTILLHCDDGRYLLDVVDVGDRPKTAIETLERDLQARGIERVQVGPEDVRREPRFSNARLIWEYHRFHPSTRDRERVLNALDERGPQSIHEIEETTTLYSDVMPIVCSLACEDIVEIDIDSRPLGPRTVVRNRR